MSRLKCMIWYTYITHINRNLLHTALACVHMLAHKQTFTYITYQYTEIKHTQLFSTYTSTRVRIYKYIHVYYTQILRKLSHTNRSTYSAYMYNKHVCSSKLLRIRGTLLRLTVLIKSEKYNNIV